jgi:aminomuconate-semialdehyde/2-hydroxymuconate-6-semialdehyde dehydrogenase
MTVHADTAVVPTVDRRRPTLSIAHVIGGELRESKDGRTFASLDPHDNRPFAEVALGGAREVNRAVTAARYAFDEGPWPRLARADRAALLMDLADAIEAEADELAYLEARDVGRPRAEVLQRDIPRSAHNFRFFAEQAKLASEESLTSPGARVHVRYQPAGVVAAISPWNFPLMLATWKIAPALAFGNTVILKPAEQSPATAARLGQLALQVGFPPGVLNVVQGEGPGSAGEALTRHPGVDRITFTGESATGRAIMGVAATNLVPVSFELGGKSPNLVFADADLDLAARETVRGIFWNAGQVCVAGSRLYVERSVYEEFLERLVTASADLTVGDPLVEGTRIGPLVSPEQRARVEAYVEEAADQVRVVLPGGRPDAPHLAHGNYLDPTILADVPGSARCMREEIFGPVLSVASFGDEDEAVRLGNDSAYGLAAMVFTNDLRRAERVSGALRVGSVWVNCFFHRDLRAPFGGVGNSGIGREGGLHSREFFTEPKAVSYAS